MTCKDYVPDGGALVGVCGAGGNHGCQGLCNPAGAHAVLCSKNANNVCGKGKGRGKYLLTYFFFVFFFFLVFFFNFLVELEGLQVDLWGLW